MEHPLKFPFVAPPGSNDHSRAHCHIPSRLELTLSLLTIPLGVPLAQSSGFPASVAPAHAGAAVAWMGRRRKVPDEKWEGSMNTEDPKKATLKQKATHELRQFAAISLYLAFFFCAVATYSLLLLNQFHVSYFIYGTALINALVIAKVILIGEYARLGKKHESKPLVQSALYKAFLFSLLVFAFHIVEEVIKRRWHGGNFTTVYHGIRMSELFARSVVIFCAFLPLFAFRELQRVLGEENFRSLFFRTGAKAKSDAG
jgi:hypothetical protein